MSIATLKRGLSKNFSTLTVESRPAGGAALHDAIFREDYKKLKKILKNKKKARSQLLAFDDDGTCPFSYALIRGAPEYVYDAFLEAYIAYNADWNIGGSNGMTVLHHAVRSNSDKIVSKLLENKGIDVNSRTDEENTPLHYFCQFYKHPNCVEPFKKFIERNASLVAKNHDGETLLHKAILNSAIRFLLVKLLLEHGADPNVRNELGDTPLHYVVRLNRPDLLGLILKAGADLAVQGRGKKTALDIAEELKFAEIVNVINSTRALYDWLEGIEMERYKLQFLREGLWLDVLGTDKSVTRSSLEEMGVLHKSDRKRIMTAIEELRETTRMNPLTVQQGPSHQKDRLTVQLSKLGTSSGSPGAEGWILPSARIEFTEALALGDGSAGRVYKGIMDNSKLVAIKVLKAITEAKEISDFKKEFEVMAAIHSEHTVQLFGACIEPKLCMVMEFCDRGSLYDVLNLPQKMNWERGLRFCYEVASSIKTLHKLSPPIIHRDIKSLNFLVTKNWAIKVCDYGLSRFDTEANTETMGKLRGTYTYVAPEIYFGEKFTLSADVYSVSVVLWEIIFRIINGRYERPYEKTRIAQDYLVLMKVAKENLRPRLPPSTPTELSDLVERCWAKKS